MSSQPNFLSPQFQAEHHHFVKRLAIGLARDEASADDLVQETWLAALTNGSKAIVRPRAWLATAMRRRAMNVARSESVRQGHELQAARGKESEDERLHEQVSFQHAVVAAVLELEEPYRSVVMLRYFQDLSPSAIARRRKLPAATVRSQLARAHTQLRTRLEQREGGREAWCLALAGFLDHSAPGLLSAPAAAIALAACTLAVGVGAAWIFMRAPARPAQELIAAALPIAPLAVLAEPAFESARVAVMAEGVQLAETAAQEGPTQAALEAKTFDDLCDMLIRIEDELRPRLLTPPADVVSAWSEQHPAAQMEFARVLDRTKFNAGFDSGAVGIRGGGAYYSFETRSHDYNNQPTIELQGRRLGSNFYGGMSGALFDLGPIDPADAPARMAPHDSSEPGLLARGPALPADARDRELGELLQSRRLESCDMILQHVYALRSISTNEHDLLAIFVPIHQDAFGITIAWTRVQEWSVPDPDSGIKNLPARKVLAPEPWTAAMSTDGLLLLLGRVRTLTTARLMAIPDALREQHPDRPLARVLRDYFGMRYVNIDGGGRYFNFATQSNNYQEAPDFGLQLQSLQFASRPGILLDLGVAGVDSVDARFVPPETEATKLGWELAWTFARTAAPPSGKGPLIVTSKELMKFHQPALTRPAEAVVGHSYLVRGIHPGEHDHLVVFEILAEDEHGIFITWRILKTWPA